MTDYLTQNGRNTGCLVLAPKVVHAMVPELHTLHMYLQDSQFIGGSLPDLSNGSFAVGEAFLQLISFMGCSPHIDLAPPAHGGAFCYVRIEGPWPDPKLRYGRNTKAPRCSSCRNRLTNWQEMLTVWLVEPQTMVVECPHCGHKQCPLNLGWRREAGFGYLFVVVENIFPGEAAPVSGFLKGLEGITGVPWQYFYIWD